MFQKKRATQPELIGQHSQESTFSGLSCQRGGFRFLICKERYSIRTNTESGLQGKLTVLKQQGVWGESPPEAEQDTMSAANRHLEIKHQSAKHHGTAGKTNFNDTEKWDHFEKCWPSAGNKQHSPLWKSDGFLWLCDSVIRKSSICCGTWYVTWM